MLKIEKIYPRDIIAFFVLMFSLVLISKGLNAIVSGIVIMIVTYYFSKRAYEEKHPNGDLHERVKKIEHKVDQLPVEKTGPIPSKVIPSFRPSHNPEVLTMPHAAIKAN